MIIKEEYGKVYNSDKVLYITYSDQNVKILQVETNIVYNCAIDVETANYTYIETDIPIEEEEV